MAYSYEAVVSPAGLALFEDTFSLYMAGLNFRHMKIGGWLGGHDSHEFRKDGHLVSFTSTNEGQSHFRIVVHSDTENVQQLVINALTEGAASLLQPFCEALCNRSSEQIFESLSGQLREAFQRIVSDDN